MTEFLQTLILVGVGTVVTVPAVDDTINIVSQPNPSVEVSFTTAPQGATFTFTAGTTVYTTTSKYTAPNTAITFTPSVILPLAPTNLHVVEYYWDFGDGVTGYGSPVTHTYTLSGTSPQAVLRVTDNYGREWFCRKQMYIS
jgi:hypothetical protein